MLILIFAAATRIINVSSWPVWTDEGWSIWATDDAHLNVVLDNLAHDRHPPLYFVALRGWRSLAGDSPLVLRYLSIAAGLLTVAVTYRIGADVFSDKQAGLYAALVLAALPIAVYYSQEVRHYGWFTLMVMLSWLCFLRYLRRPRLGILLGYILSTTLAFYTLYFAVLPLAVQIVVGLVWDFRGWYADITPIGRSAAHSRKKLSNPRMWLLAAWMSMAVLYAPWLWVIATIQFPTLTSGIGNLPGTYAPTLANIPPLGELLLGTQWALPLGFAVLGIWAIQRYKIRGGTPRRRVILLAGLGLLVFMFILSVKFNLLSARTLVFLVPSLVVVCGYGASISQDQTSTLLKPSYTLANVLLGAWVLVTLATPMVIQPRIDSDQAARMVAQDYAAGDLIVLETGWDDNAFAYELRQVIPDAEIIRTITRADIYSHDKDLLPAITPQFESHRRTWVIQWLQAPQIMNALEGGASGYRAVLRRELPVNADYRQRFGDSVIKMVLYEKPQLDGTPHQFGEVFSLRDALVPTQARAGERLPVDLWWSALQQPTLDYSVGVFVLDASSAVRADHNGPPADKPTPQWAVDELYFDRHTLTLPPDLPAGHYSIVVKVYWYGDNQALPVEGQPYVTIGEIEVQ